jgi:predicted HicB family RNase H-like nuclease
MMEYKGYAGRVDYDDEAGIFHGEVINTRDVITFQGTTVKELRKAFRDSVEDYLAFCDERGEEPGKPFSGQFITRVSPDVHRRINIAATVSGKSLNAWVTAQLERGVQEMSAKEKIVREKSERISASNRRELWRKICERAGIPTKYGSADLTYRFIVHCQEGMGKEVAEELRQTLGEDQGEIAIFKKDVPVPWDGEVNSNTSLQVAVQEGGDSRWPLHKKKMREALPGRKVLLLYIERRDSRGRLCDGWTCVTLSAVYEATEREYQAVIFSAD